MRRRSVLLVVVAVTALVIAAASAVAAPKAICVPWNRTHITLDTYWHPTYSGAMITVQGIARGDATEFRWDYGDGGGTAWTPIADAYNLGADHAYTGADGQTFTATLHVRNAGGEEATDTFPVMIYKSVDLSVPAELDVRIGMSVDKGLWWLHKSMIRGTGPAGAPWYSQPYGYWDPGYYPTAACGTAVDAFQLNGSKCNGDYEGDPYVETVQRAINYLLVSTCAFSIGPQSAGNPDSNGNGIGLVTNQSCDPYDGRQTYIGGICMTALASSGAPEVTAAVGGAYVYGRKYKDIVQDMVDFCAWGQVDSGSGRGGWRYYGNYGGSDMSTTQWPPLGMLAAIQGGMVVREGVPSFVADELCPNFLTTMQYTVCNNDNGAWRYDPGQAIFNITKQGAGIICREFCLYRTDPDPDPKDWGLDVTDEGLLPPDADLKIKMGVGYIYRHWNDGGGSWDDQELHGNSYQMYGVMKAMRLPNNDILRVQEYNCTTGQFTGNSFDWYYTPAGQSQEGLASYIVRTQQADGSWDDVAGPNPVYDAFCTGWRILTLLPGVLRIPPTAEICRWEEMQCEPGCEPTDPMSECKQGFEPGKDIPLDSCSHHADKARKIVEWEWDFDYSGTFAADATGEHVVFPAALGTIGRHLVALKVTDDHPGGAQTDMIVREVCIHPPPHCPYPYAHPCKDPGDREQSHYVGWVNVPMAFDGCWSWDPNGDPLTYKWSVDTNGDDTCDLELPLSNVCNGTGYAWDKEGTFKVCLTVTDQPRDGSESCPRESYSWAEIGCHAPVANPGGDALNRYCVEVGKCVTLDGSRSSDPDPGDTITYEWDLNCDNTIDCTTATCEFCAPPDAELGDVYCVKLTVRDTLCGKSDEERASIEVGICNHSPVPKCKDVTVHAGPECTTTASVDDGCYDPDPGDTITLTQDPAGPYPIGATPVTLTVRDDKGAEATCTATVTVVNDAPICSLTVSPTAPWVNQTVTASVRCEDPEGQAVTSTIDWGDGNVVDGPGPVTHEYTAPCDYTICATCTDACGATSQCCQTITVYAPVDVKLVAVQTTGNVNLGWGGSAWNRQVKLMVLNRSYDYDAVVNAYLYRWRYRTTGDLELIAKWEGVTVPKGEVMKVLPPVLYEYQCADRPSIKFKGVVRVIECGRDPKPSDNAKLKQVSVRTSWLACP